MCSKCFGKDLLPLSMFLYVNRKKICRALKGLGTSLAPQSYAGLVSSRFLRRVAKVMTTGNKGKIFITFVPFFTLSLLSKIVCSLCPKNVLNLQVVTIYFYFSLCFITCVFLDQTSLQYKSRCNRIQLWLLPSKI